MSGLWDGLKRRYVPEDEIWMRHKVCDSLEHASRFEHKGREGDLVKVHAHSDASPSVSLKESPREAEHTHLNWDIIDETIDPSCSSLGSSSQLSAPSKNISQEIWNAKGEEMEHGQDRSVIWLCVLRDFIVYRGTWFLDSGLTEEAHHRGRSRRGQRSW
jgi:hypothetical protein